MNGESVPPKPNPEEWHPGHVKQLMTEAVSQVLAAERKGSESGPEETDKAWNITRHSAALALALMNNVSDGEWRQAEPGAKEVVKGAEGLAELLEEFKGPREIISESDSAPGQLGSLTPRELTYTTLRQIADAEEINGNSGLLMQYGMITQGIESMLGVAVDGAARQVEIADPGKGSTVHFEGTSLEALHVLRYDVFGIESTVPDGSTTGDTDVYTGGSGMEDVLNRLRGEIDAKMARMFGGALSEAERSEIEDIAYNNKLGTYDLTKPLGKFDYTSELEKRMRALELYERDPDLAGDLINLRIAGFHGSDSGALLSVIEQGGLLPGSELEAREILISGGERVYSRQGHSISFADWRAPESIREYTASRPYAGVEEIRRLAAAELAVAERNEGEYGETLSAINRRKIANSLNRMADFVEENPDTLKAQLMLANFPIAFGVCVDGLPTVETVYDSMSLTSREPGTTHVVERFVSDVKGEFLVRGGVLDIEKLKVVAVPEREVERVQKILNENGVSHMKVISLEDLTR